MRCDQCRHWDQDTEIAWEAEDIGFGLCRAVKERWEIQDSANDGSKFAPEGSTEYEEDAWLRRRKDALRDARAFVQDGSEYVAELVTGPDFFCALFEQK